MPPRRAAILTLGCKLNLADSEEIARGLRDAGFEVVDHVCEADAYVVNTCAVTHVADAKSRKLIRSVRRLSPAARVAVTGCYPRAAAPAELNALGADLVTDTRDEGKAALVSFLAGACPPAAPVDNAPAGLFTARAFIKAQEGCNDVCAFCIVPRTRGRESSRPVAEVVRRVDEAVRRGAREVVITGTQLGAWGRDLDPPLVPHHLIAGLLEHTEAARIRFSSLQPQDISPELLALWQDPRLMPHFHLALQSGSDATLAAMRRRYTALEFVRAARAIRAAVRGAAITTDVIAGFPGETEDDFEATLAVCREVGFSRIHAFPYSPRQRTAAAAMLPQTPHEVRKERMARLLETGEMLSRAFRQGQGGTVRPVLWEDDRPGPDGPRGFGHTDNYIPVYADTPGMPGHITPVRLGPVYHDGVRVSPLEAP